MERKDLHPNKLTAGNAKPSADKQNAPNKLINNSKFGIATANKTFELNLKD